MHKGFTLIELLIVIAILAILATTVVLVLNPAQILAETRDGQRLNDMGTLQSAISLYLANSSSPQMSYRGSCAASCFTHRTDVTNAGCAGVTGQPARHSATDGGGATKNAAASSSVARTVSGFGWLPIKFDDISGGAPFSLVPIDPTNSSQYFYSYACSQTNRTFELNANMESSRYQNDTPTPGSGNVEINTKDGGDVDNLYEVGNDPSLDL